MRALFITAGWVAGDPRNGDPAVRLADAACTKFGDSADDAMQSVLQWAEKARHRRTDNA